MLAADVSDGYIAAVIHSWEFVLGTAWARLSAVDPTLDEARAAEMVQHLTEFGVDIWFGDGDEPVIPATGASVIAEMRELALRVGHAAPAAFTRPSDALYRILCTDPYPRVYTTAVLEAPASTPVHVVQCSDLAGHPEWAKVPQLAKFGELRALLMFGAPLDRAAFPLDLSQLGELRYLDLRECRLREIPREVVAAQNLEMILLDDNPLTSVDALAALPKLRSVGLRRTGLGPSLQARLPDCEVLA